MIDITVRENIELTGKAVSVVGAGKSGMAAAKLLNKVGADVFLSDQNTLAPATKELSELESLGVVIESGGHSERIYEADMMVVSPGVPQDAGAIRSASEKEIPVVSEIELASWFTDLPIVAVTGSNGKTTTTTMLAEMCAKDKFTPFLAGNIGTPFAETVASILEAQPDNGIHILEISSFQMEHICHFRPKVSVLLNLSADHLDRYPSMNEYAAAKLRIIENMTSSDKVVFNGDDLRLSAMIDTAAQLIPFSLTGHGDSLFSVNETKVYDETHEILVYKKDVSLPGNHNLANLLAAATACSQLGVNVAAIREVMQTFSGVPHRLEHVLTLDGVDYYNDSKATNIDSVKVALDSFPGPIILIMGGRDKGADFRELHPYLAGKVKQIIVLGEAADRIQESLSPIPPSTRAHSLDSAVSLAHDSSEPGDTVILAPACASFDMFANYEERGDCFKQAVNSLESQR